MHAAPAKTSGTKLVAFRRGLAGHKFVAERPAVHCRAPVGTSGLTVRVGAPVVGVRARGRRARREGSPVSEVGVTRRGV